MKNNTEDRPGKEAEYGEVFETEQELGRRIKAEPITLQAWRRLGKGPPFVRLGRAIRYNVRAVDAWIAARTVKGAL